LHHHTIQINQPTRCNRFTSLLPDVYMWLNTFRASPRPSSGAYNCTRNLWFYRWREESGVLLVVVRPDQDQQFLQFIILTFVYSSTCFGRPHAHHQELNHCSISFWFYLRPASPTTTNSTNITTLRR